MPDDLDAKIKFFAAGMPHTMMSNTCPAVEAADDKLIDGLSEDDLTATSEVSERNEFHAEVS